MGKVKGHPYHYWQDKNLLQQLVDYLVPVGLFFLYFFFYNFGKFTPSEMIKTTGLLSITLLGLTLVIGPLCKFFPGLNFLKAHRKMWGILSFFIAFIHMGLVLDFYYKWSLTRFIDYSNPKYPAILSGLLSLVILFFVTLTSNPKALAKLDPEVWKAIQTTSYLALILAVSHFFLMESVNGSLVIKKLLGQITFYFATVVVLLRVIIIFLPSKR